MENLVPCKIGYILYSDTPSKRFVFYNANRTEKKEFILFSDAVENLIVALPKALEKAQSLTQEEINEDQEAIFSEDLSCFSGVDEKTKKILMFKNRLSVNTYQGYLHIWLKRFFYDADRQLWLACRGGFRFNPKSDDFEAILDWLKYHVEVIKQDKKEAKPEAVAPPPPAAAAAAAAAVEASQSLSLSDDN
jgi:hypothetical protein